MLGEPALVLSRNRAVLERSGGIFELEGIDVPAMLVIDDGRAALGIHIHTVDAPTQGPPGVGDAQAIEGVLKICRLERHEGARLIAHHALELRQDLVNLCALACVEGHKRAGACRLATRVLRATLVKSLVQDRKSRRHVLGAHAVHACFEQLAMEAEHDIVDEVALFDIAKAGVDRRRTYTRGNKPAQGAGAVAFDLRSG